MPISNTEVTFLETSSAALRLTASNSFAAAGKRCAAARARARAIFISTGLRLWGCGSSACGGASDRTITSTDCAGEADGCAVPDCCVFPCAGVCCGVCVCGEVDSFNVLRSSTVAWACAHTPATARRTRTIGKKAKLNGGLLLTNLWPLNTLCSRKCKSELCARLTNRVALCSVLSVESSRVKLRVGCLTKGRTQTTGRLQLNRITNFPPPQ